GAWMDTGRRSASVTGTAAALGADNGAPVRAATSRATPRIDRQSARLGVSFRVNSVSSRSSASRSDWPGASSAGSSSRPAWSCDRPSSRAEHSMPADCTPRILATPILMPPGSSAPTRASGTVSPAAALGAPQTICSSSPEPSSTWQTRSLSASGCGAMATMRATTTPVKGGAAGAVSSTSRPAMVSRCASSSVAIAGMTRARSQDSGNCIISRGLFVELAQEAQIAFVELAQVVDAVAQHGQALEAGAEREADVALGVEPEIAHDLRMHLAGAGDLEPAAAIGAGGEHHVDLGRRLGEREERRAEPHDQVVAFEEAAQEVGVDPFEIGKGDVLGDPEPFDLVEHGRMGGVAVDAIGAARRDDLDGRLVHARIAHLHGAGMGTQQQRQAVAVLQVDVEGVLHGARRVVQRVVQRGEVGPVVFNLGAVGHVEADGAENLL